MKKTSCFWLLLLFNLIVWTSPLSAQTLVLDYQSIPGYSASTCFFNTSPGPVNPKSIGGYNHYGIVGGVDYTGNEFSLATDAVGGGTAFGIFHSFSLNYKYTIKVEARASASTVAFLWAINSIRTATPSSCSPGFASVITSGANPTASFTNVSGTYSEYTLVQNFTPSTSGMTYLLMSAYNTVASIGSLQIRKVTIIASPVCLPLTITSATSLGNGQIQVAFNTPLYGVPPPVYNLQLVRYVFSGPVLIVLSAHNFPNVGSSSPVTVTIPFAGGNYYAVMKNVCGTETVNSNFVYFVVN